MYTITPISAFKDNYIWLITDSTRSYGVLVDPGDAVPVITFVQNASIIPVAVLLTHHHWDHSGGIPELANRYAMQVYGSTQEDGTQILIPELQLTFTVMAIPGHTLDHVAYYGHGMLFCGDTLFSAGCGRVFEGTMAQMYQSLSRLANLPDDTKMYCGHEYTHANLRFAQTVEPDNADIAARIEAAKHVENTLPSTIGLEKKINPFLRCAEPAVIAAAEKQAGHVLSDPIQVFQTLREWKNGFS